MSDPDGSVWIFGYGSLIWRPSFEFVQQRWGYVHGYIRRFWQGSPDHRGTEDNPGRVVTLLLQSEEPDCVDSLQNEPVWGVVYQIDASHKTHILSYLDHREQGGYTCEQANVYIQESNGEVSIVKALLYRATPENEHYLGPADLHDIAKHIATSAGPSGDNSEYLFRLAESLRAQGLEAPHEHELERLVRKLLQQENLT